VALKNTKQIEIYDTTLRDGCQGEGVSFSVEDKLRVAHRLDRLGVAYIEGGWPGSNPRDVEFFARARRERWERARLAAFGSTRRAGVAAASDANLRSLVEAGTPAVTLFGKSWDLHVRRALEVSLDENLAMIGDSVAYLRSRGLHTLYDAEHFFDGLADNRDYALATLRAAAEAGADRIVLCDTNGGTLTRALVEAIRAVRAAVRTPLGIHTHDDSGLGVANALAAVEEGCIHVQGTINGYGERCGNANLCTVIPDLELKMGRRALPAGRLADLCEVSRYVSEMANLHHHERAPFVGRSAFAHKGGIHVSAVLKHPRTYEHIEPEAVGNERRVLVSDLSGQSNVVAKARRWGLPLDKDRPETRAILGRVKDLEYDGYQFEGAEASFEILVKEHLRQLEPYFHLEGFRVIVEKNGADAAPRAEATVKVSVAGSCEHTAAEGHGPVNALDNALRKALGKFYPRIGEIRLTDYKVRVLNEKDATAARVRVLVETSDGKTAWGTVGVSDNIIEASWEALVDAVTYKLMQDGETASRRVAPEAAAPAARVAQAAEGGGAPARRRSSPRRGGGTAPQRAPRPERE
jgi:2-isopropylmalate synthase